MKKKVCSVFVVCIMASTLVGPKAEAFIVHDPTSLASIVLRFKEQFEQVEQGRLHLKKVFNQLLSLNGSFETFRDIDSMTRSVRLDYMILQGHWNDHYVIDPKAAKDKSSGKYYANKTKELTQLTNDAIYDAKIAQGMITRIDLEIADLKTIISCSEKAEGALQVAQLANQIAALQAAQLMRAQYITASSQHAQSAYQAQESVRKQMVTQATERYYATEAVNYIKGQGPGIIGIK